MKWSHLPVAGGLYDQSPELLDKWRYIFTELAKHEAKEEAKKKNKTPQPRTVKGRR